MGCSWCFLRLEIFIFLLGWSQVFRNFTVRVWDVSCLIGVGSLVPELFSLETYPTLHQMTSRVTSRLKPEAGFADIFKSLFPCGSVTGAPKIRAMEIIDELEAEKRGIYAGAVGYISSNGDMDTAIALRTGIVKDGTLHVRAGAGIVMDSVPKSEFEETLHKAAALFRAAEQSVKFDRN